MLYSDVILAEASLQSYWHLNEAAGDSIDQKAAVAGTYNAGTRAVTKLLPGEADKAWEGVSASSSNIDYGNNYGFTGTASFSVEFWCKPTNVIPASPNFLAAKLATSNQGGWVFDYWTGGTRFRRFDVAAGADNALGAVLAVGSIYHIVGTYDGTDLKIYLNAETPATQASSRVVPAHANVLALGGFGGGGSSADAVFDEFSIYNVALTAADVRRHFDAGAYRYFSTDYSQFPKAALRPATPVRL